VRLVISDLLIEKSRKVRLTINDLFSNREIASSIWLIIFLIFIFWNPKTRKPAFKVLQTAAVKKIVIPFIIIIVYATILVMLFSSLSFWKWIYMKEICIWVIFVGVPVCFGAVMINKNDHYFKNLIINNFKLIVIVELLLSSFTFSMAVELIMLPAITVIILLEVVASTDKKYIKVRRMMSFLLTVAGFMILLFTLKIAIANYMVLNNIDFLITFLIPAVLSLFFLPVAYSYAVISEYEQLFIRMKFRMPDNKQIRRYRWEIIKVCKFSFKEIKRFRATHLNKLYRRMKREEFYEVMCDFSEKGFEDIK